MKEAFLHHLWNYKLLDQSLLVTYHGSPIEIIQFGKLNFHSGPDFYEAEIVIGNQLWVGSVEMHVNSSDWDLHQHSEDLAYQNVILHVVWNHDKEIDILRQRNVETLVLKDYVNKEIIFNYDLILNNNSSNFPCEKLISNLNLENVNFWLDRLLIDRLEIKSNHVLRLLEATHQNWEEVTFRLLAYNFGLKINSDGFEYWSKSFPFQVLQKCQSNPIQIPALFFGQAGFLTDPIDEYMKLLKNEYDYLKHKYQLRPITNSVFKFSSLRPLNFPTLRLAQLGSIYAVEKKLFSKIISFEDFKSIENYFEKIPIDSYWETHYVFGKESKRISKKISKSKIQQLIINFIIPLRFTYDLTTDQLNAEWFIELLENLKAEQNNIVNTFREAGFKVENAKDSQTILHLKKYYCDEKKCLNCAIGTQILNQ